MCACQAKRHSDADCGKQNLRANVMCPVCRRGGGTLWVGAGVVFPSARPSPRPLLALAFSRARLVAHVRGAGEVAQLPLRNAFGLLDTRERSIQDLGIYRVGQIKAGSQYLVQLLTGEGTRFFFDLDYFRLVKAG